MKPSKIILASYVVFFFSSVVYGQDISTPDSLEKLDSVVTNMLYISSRSADKPYKKVKGFILESVDSSGNTIWKSKAIVPSDSDSEGYFVRAEIPLKITKFHSTINCSAIYSDLETDSTRSARRNSGGLFGWGTNRAKTIRSTRPVIVSMPYGATTGGIELELKSNPRGAETFLVPLRIWRSKIERPEGIDYEALERNWRVNGGLTDLPVYVDERVFMVVFKLNGQYKILRHNTQPKVVSAKQPVFVTF